MSDKEPEKLAEIAYWEFDARRKGYGEWELHPQTERDAFKSIIESFAQRRVDEALTKAARIAEEFVDVGPGSSVAVIAQDICDRICSMKSQGATNG